MRLGVFSVYDQAVKSFLQPFYARHVGEAVRSFTDLANNPETNVYRHPGDFVLYRLGEFDDGSGLFECGEPVRIVSAREVAADVASASLKSA